VGTDDNDFSCLATATGRIEWHWSAAGDVVGTAVVDRRRVYFTALDHLLRAVDRESGVQKWRAPLRTRPRTGPLPFNKVLFTAGVAPGVHAFAVEDGAELGVATAPGDLAGPPHIVEGLIEADATLYVLTADGQLAAFRSALTMPPPLPPAAAPPPVRKQLAGPWPRSAALQGPSCSRSR
jgi:outer membrane protein assembly factor BamB